jgi:hypothetical protein
VVALSESGGAPTSVASPSSDCERCMYDRFGSVRPIQHTRRRMAGICAKPPRDWVSRMMFRDLRSIGSASLAVTLQSAPPTPECLLPRYRGSEPCFRASCGPRGAAPCAGSWFVDRSRRLGAYGMCPVRGRIETNFPRPRNLQSGGRSAELF